MRLVSVGKSFGEHRLFQGLDLDVHTGQTTVIIGQSGSGKSVLLKMLMGLVAPDSGRVEMFGRDLASASGSEIISMRKRCAMLFQSYALLDSFTVYDNIAFPLRENTSMPESEIRARVEELLDLLELPSAGTKLPSELSGGMKKRVSLARALITSPEVVLFDEPTTGLDPVMIEFVDEMIRRARERFGITSVIISHDMGSVFKLADRIGMLHDGSIVAFGTPDEIRRVDHPVLQAFIGAGGSGRLTSPDALSGAEAGPVVVREAPGPEPAVRLEGVHKWFGEHHVLKGVDLEIPEGLITVIIGGSGSGKSVIVKHIMGLLQASQGRVVVFGQDLGGLGPRDLAAIQARIGFLFQGAALFDSMTIRDNVAFPLVERGLARGRELHERVGEILEQVNIAGIADRYPAEVSAGERKRAGLARALVTRPEIMIYDEPTTGQDPIMIRSVDEMIHSTWERLGITSIVISHDMQSTFRIGHRIAMLHQGRIRAFGTPEQLLSTTDPVVRRFVFAGSPEPSEDRAA